MADELIMNAEPMAAKDAELNRLVSEHTVWEIDRALEPWRQRMRALNGKLTEAGVLPGLFIFRRRKVGKKRKAKKASTRDQNNMGVMTAAVMTLNDYGTVKRIAKHRGFSEFVSVVPLTEQEQSDYGRDYRYSFPKYKSFHELYLRRGSANELLTDPAWQEITGRLERMYQTNATGQLRMF